MRHLVHVGSARVMGLVFLGGAAANAALGGNSLSVCISADRIVRQKEGTTCPAGAREYDLALDTPELDVPPDEEAATAAQVDELKRTVRNLSETVRTLASRVAALETGEGSRGAASTVTAPFQVVDQDGGLLFLVTGKKFVEAPRARVTIARGQTDNFNFSINRTNGVPAVSMGERNTLGSGLLRLSHGNGKLSILLAEEGVTVTNNSGNAVAGLMLGSGGGGVLELSSEGGTPVVQAGMVESGIGVVRVGPRFVCGASSVRQPDCLLGRQ